MQKNICPSCQHEIPEGSRFCPHCGKPLNSDTNATSYIHITWDGKISLVDYKIAVYVNGDLQGKYSYKKPFNVTIPVVPGTVNVKCSIELLIPNTVSINLNVSPGKTVSYHLKLGKISNKLYLEPKAPATSTQQSPSNTPTTPTQQNSSNTPATPTQQSPPNAPTTPTQQNSSNKSTIFACVLGLLALGYAISNIHQDKPKPSPKTPVYEYRHTPTIQRQDPGIQNQPQISCRSCYGTGYTTDGYAEAAHIGRHENCINRRCEICGKVHCIQFSIHDLCPICKGRGKVNP